MSSDADLGIEGLEQAEAVGRGGFAVVYRAWQPAFHRMVAVKVLGVRLDEEAAGRFERECTTMGQLSEHPAIVTVLDAGFTSDGRPWLAMPFMSGGSLQDRLDRGAAFSWEEMLDIGVSLAGALAAAHEAGVLHRDVKPANVMLSRYREAMLSDFGIARVAGGPETASGVVTASITYAAPEILDGQRPAVASDVYSLGATLYALVHGDAPFAVDTDESLVPLLKRILHDPVPDLRAADVPDDVCAALEHAMAKDPAERPAAVSDLGRVLQDCQRRHGLTVTRMVLSEALGSRADQAAQLDGGDAPAGATHRDGAPSTATVGGPPSNAWGSDADASSAASEPTPAQPPAARPTGDEPASPGGGGRRRLLLGLGGLTAVVLAGGVVWQLVSGGPGGGLDFGGRVDGQITQAGDVDPHRLAAADGDVFAVHLRSTDLDPLLRLRDADGGLVAQDDNSGGGENGTDALMLGPFPRAGHYEVEAGGTDDTIGAYTLTVSGGRPTPLGLDEPVRGSIDEPGAVGFSAFEAEAGDVFVLRMAAQDTVLDSFLLLFGPDGERLAEDDDSGFGLSGRDAMIILRAPADGTYVAVAMALHAATVGTYQLTLQQPVPVRAGEAVDASIDAPGEIDAYAVPARQGQTFEVRMASETLDSTLVAFDPSGAFAAEDDDSGGGVNGLDALLVGEPDTDGTFVVLARGRDPAAVGRYRLEVDLTP